MLTRRDLELLREMIQGIVNSAVDPIKERLNLLPTKDEYFTKMDKLTVELQRNRQNQDAISHRQSENGKRLNTIEDELNIPHPS